MLAFLRPMENPSNKPTGVLLKFPKGDMVVEDKHIRVSPFLATELQKNPKEINLSKEKSLTHQPVIVLIKKYLENRLEVQQANIKTY
jgi:hypothetical protein